MSFKEKSTAAMLAVMVAVYGWYFARIMAQASDGAVDSIVYKPLLIGLVVLLVVGAIVAHIVIVAFSPNASDEEDERDRLIEMRADQISSYVLAVGTIGGLWLVLVDAEAFWIAHALVAGLFVSEVVKNSIMLVAYRRGY